MWERFSSNARIVTPNQTSKANLPQPPITAVTLLAAAIGHHWRCANATDLCCRQARAKRSCGATTPRMPPLAPAPMPQHEKKTPFFIGLGKYNREPRTEPKKPRTETEPYRNWEFRVLFGFWFLGTEVLGSVPIPKSVNWGTEPLYIQPINLLVCSLLWLWITELFVIVACFTLNLREP